MEESINATDLRIRTRDVIERARFKGARFIVHIFGRPAVIIMGIDEYNSLMQALADAHLTHPANPSPVALPSVGGISAQAPDEHLPVLNSLR